MNTVYINPHVQQGPQPPQPLTQKNKLLRSVYYGFLIIYLIFFITLNYVGSDLIAFFVNYFPLLDTSLFPLFIGIFTIALAILIIVIVIFGWFGVHRLNDALICIYIICLGISILAHSILVVVALALQDSTVQNYKSNMVNKISLYDETFFPEYTKAWNLLQTEFNCCGAESVQDWRIMYPNYKLPASCCYVYTDCNVHSPYLRQSGCLNPMMTELLQKVWAIVTVSLVFIAVQILGLITGIVAKIFNRKHLF